MTKKDFVQKWIRWVAYTGREELTVEMEQDLNSLVTDNPTKTDVPNTNTRFAKDVKVKIARCIKGHEFEIGETVLLLESNGDMWLAVNDKGKEWHINEEEATVILNQ